ncbi:hypothetical protein [Salibacterium lacus]|uniref:Uncharacterized protein n=1 Tax=Salibacterium lacus TaxID=1898109 RepID=A0ABW5SWD0_9BACI
MKELLINPGFLGSLSGAVITGTIALIVMQGNIKFERNLRNKEELKKYIKEATYLKMYVTRLISTMNQYTKYQREEENLGQATDQDGFPTDELNEIMFAKNMIEEDVKRYITKIKGSKREDILEEYFDDYLEIIDITETGIEYFWERSIKNRTDGVADILNEEIKKLQESNEKLKKSIEKQQGKISEI